MKSRDPGLDTMCQSVHGWGIAPLRSEEKERPSAPIMARLAGYWGARRAPRDTSRLADRDLWSMTEETVVTFVGDNGPE